MAASRAIMRAAALAGFGGVGTAAGVAANDEGTARSAKFWYHVGPVYLRYRVVQARAEDLVELGAPSWMTFTSEEANRR